MRSATDNMWMTYPPVDNMRMTYPPADDMWMTSRRHISSASPNLQQSLTLMLSACCLHIIHMSSTRHTHETSVPRLFQVKQQRTALLKIKTVKASFDPFDMSKMSNITLYIVLCKSHKHYFRPFRHPRNAPIVTFNILEFRP